MRLLAPRLLCHLMADLGMRLSRVRSSELNASQLHTWLAATQYMLSELHCGLTGNSLHQESAA